MKTSPSVLKMFLKIVIIITFCSTSWCESTGNPQDDIYVSTTELITTNTTVIPNTTSLLKLLRSTSTKGTTKASTISYTTESSTTRDTTTQTRASVKGLLKTTGWEKLNTSYSALGNMVHSAPRLQDRLGAVDCDLPVLPRESRLWRGNETHELNFPVKECAAGHRGSEEDCPPLIMAWGGSADIQSGDILIVRITDPTLLESKLVDVKNGTVETNSTHMDEDRSTQPAVYQVTRQGHDHCDVSDGMLLDITPLDEQGAKLFTLYDKDLTEGVNLLIVVSAKWESQCVRLKVTVKSDNCGESQECSGKGVCYTNASMEGYECQCCPGYVGPHCEDRDACNPSPCRNNGICVDLTQPLNGASYHCLCPYGFTGRMCEKDPCFSTPCLNGGSCMSMAMNGSTSFHCACAEGWTGAHCDITATGGVCESKPCVKGICVEQTDNDIYDTKYRCFCEPGYTGDKCELEYNECESSPCASGGTCTDQVAGFSCACSRGYTGNMCQLKVDLCSPNPCSSQRYCIDHGNSYTCECPRGFIGDECHIPATSVCDNNPCAHGGTCWSGVNSFYCSCRPGYTGRLCEEDFILEPVIDGENEIETGKRSLVRQMHLPLGLYHDRLHNVFIAAGTLGAAIAIVGVVVTACHCRVNKTYARLLSRVSRVREAGAPHHWLQDKRAPAPLVPPPAPLDTTDMYYTLDFSDSQSSPLIQ